MSIVARSIASVLAFAFAACSTPPGRQVAEYPSVVVAFEDAPFAPFDPGRPDGPGVAVLWGDPRIGRSAMFLRIDRGAISLHTHSSDYHLLVVQGLIKHWGANGSEADARPLGPGSYWFQAANEVHGDACVSDTCTAFLVWHGKQDGKRVEPARR